MQRPINGERWSACRDVARGIVQTRIVVLNGECEIVMHARMRFPNAVQQLSQVGSDRLPESMVVHKWPYIDEPHASCR